MMFSIPQILRDGNELVKDLRANIKPETRQARIKCVLGEQPLDITIFSVSKPALEKMVAKVNIQGQEMVTDVKFNVTIGYQVLKNLWSMEGTIGFKRFTESLNNLSDLLLIIKKYI